MTKFDKIIELIRREEVVLFVGSGCSIAAKAPSASDLTNRIKGILGKSFIPPIDTLQDVSDALVFQDKNRDRLNRILIDSFSSLKPAYFHRTLSKIPYIKDIVTTNYDNLIESSYDQGSVQIFAEDQDCGNYLEDKYHIYTIHGDCEHLDRVIITNSDYRHTIRSHRAPLLWGKVQSLFATKHIVFVGYSLQDANFKNLIEDIRNNEGIKSKQLYLITLKLDPLAIAQLNRDCREMSKKFLAFLTN